MENYNLLCLLYFFLQANVIKTEKQPSIHGEKIKKAENWMNNYVPAK